MKKFGTAFLIAVITVLAACGSGGSDSNSIEGTWYASLATSPTAGTETITFTNTLAMTTPTTVNGVTVNLSASGLNISDNGGCFDNNSAQIGSFVTDQNGNSFTFGLQSANAMVVMNGSMKSGQLSGTWSSAGSRTSCNGSGNFTMTKGSAPGYPKRGT